MTLDTHCKLTLIPQPVIKPVEKDEAVHVVFFYFLMNLASRILIKGEITTIGRISSLVGNDGVLFV